MAKEEFNSLIVKPVSIAAGIVGLIQGLAWTVFSILCICCHTEAIGVERVNDPNGNEYYKYIYLIFLNRKSQESLGADLIVNPGEFFIFMWFYLAFSVIWTAISGAVIWAMIHNQWHLIKNVLGGWVITTFLISIIDVVFTALIGRDYNELNFTGQYTTVLVSYGIVMTMAARGYIVWIINIIFASILTKFIFDVIKHESKENTLPFINGYETSRANPPWFNGTVPKDLWAEPTTPRTPVTPKPNGRAYENHGFERSHSFFPATRSQSMENFYTDDADNSPRAPHNRPQNSHDSFAAAIAHNANKVATIGRSKERRSPLNNVPPPVIPEPDYTPPSTLNGLKSVLRSKSNY